MYWHGPVVGNRVIGSIRTSGSGGGEAEANRCKKKTFRVEQSQGRHHPNSGSSEKNLSVQHSSSHNPVAMDDTCTNGTSGSNGSSSGSKLLWKHRSPETTPMYMFLQSVNKTHGLQLSSYKELHQWSIENIDQFWKRTWDFVGIRHQGTPSSVSCD